MSLLFIRLFASQHWVLFNLTKAIANMSHIDAISEQAEVFEPGNPSTEGL